jgi:hypothetical protein
VCALGAVSLALNACGQLSAGLRYQSQRRRRPALLEGAASLLFAVILAGAALALACMA